MNQNQNIKNQ